MTPEQLAKSGSEDAHQMALFAWARLEERRYPMLKWLHAIPNGGLRSPRTGAKMKATGARKGVWDVHLPVPVQDLRVGPEQWAVKLGLYIEMKKPGVGRLSDKQKQFREHLIYYGYDSVVCFTWEEAKAAILEYLSPITPEMAARYKEHVPC